MSDLGYLRQLLAGARLREMLIETKRIDIEGADPRTIATAGGDPYSGYAQAVIVQARAI